MGEQTTGSLSSKAKYHFWLAFTALLMSGVFAFLGLGAFSAGDGLEMSYLTSAPNGAPEKSFLIYDITGVLFLLLAPICLWLAWKFRPAED